MDCCLPVAERLRRSGGPRPSPFDEIRASSALLLWSLLASETAGSPSLSALSRAAQRFWGPVLAGMYAKAPDERNAFPPAERQSAFPTAEVSASCRSASPPRKASAAPTFASPPTKASAAPAFASPPAKASTAPPATPEDEPLSASYGLRLFERTWGAVDADTLTWIHASLPSFVRDDPLLGELALDWLLWDQPWLRDHPAAWWTARSGPMARRPPIRHTTDALLGSRIGLWRLAEAVPRRGFHLRDRLTGDRTFLHTASDPWPETDRRLLLARVYAFGDWRLIAGRSLLLDPEATADLLAVLDTRATAVRAPAPHDPRWRPWLKAALTPIAAGQWLTTRLAPTLPAGYHGTYC